jgi:hypothetical protein
LLPSVIAVCLPILELRASAAETVTVPDGAGSWEMTISPQKFAAEGGSPILLAYQEDTENGAAVPDPVEPGEQANFAAPESAENGEKADESLPTVSPAPAIDPAAYWCVYRTIPFLRTEYLANPSYRHEATMEFLFGQLRPTVVHKHQNVAHAAPAVLPAPIPPYVYDIYMGQIPTFMQRYQPPAIPFGYPLNY